MPPGVLPQRTLPLALIAVLAAILVAACGADGPSTGESAAAATNDAGSGQPGQSYVLFNP